MKGAKREGERAAQGQGESWGGGRRVRLLPSETGFKLLFPEQRPAQIASAQASSKFWQLEMWQVEL